MRRPARWSGGRGPYRWSDSAIEAELRRFTAELEEFPTLLELDIAGRSDLRSAIVDNGGASYWARRVGLPLPASRTPVSYGLDEALADARQVVEQLGRLPGEPTLRRLGYGRLATVVRRSGGAVRFAIRHGLPTSR